MLISLADAKTHLNMTTIDAARDVELQFWLDVTTRWVEDRVGPVNLRTVTQTTTPHLGLVYLKGPVVSLTSMAGAYGYTDTYVVTDYYLDAESGVVRPGPGDYLCSPLTVTYVAGRVAVPDAMSGAARMLAKALWDTQRGASKRPGLGGDDIAEMPGMGLAVWKAEQLLHPYLRNRVHVT